MRRRGFPKKRELVICKIIRINPHSAIVELIEYKKTGLIYASEVARKWVKNIKEFIKEGQIIVCTVMDTRGDTIELSIKRVKPEESSRKLTAYKKEKRAEKLLERVAKNLNKSLEDAYKDVGYDMQENFGSIVKGFEIAWKNPDLLIDKLGKNDWTKEIIDVANKSFVEKTHNVKSKLKLISYSPDGVNVIKKALNNAVKKGFEVRYISTPKYELIKSGKDFKKIRQDVEAMSEEIVKEINKKKGDCSFEIEGK